MDEAQLKKILEEMEIPPADENARKRAVNFAVAEFKALETKYENEPQGFDFLFRLMGKTTRKRRRDPMQIKSKQKLIYGGMATAMAVVLIAGVSFTQLQTFDRGSPAENDLALTAQTVTPPAATEEANQAYVAAIQEENEARTGQAQAQGSSAIPTPVEPPVGRLTVTEEAKKEVQTTDNLSSLTKNLVPGEKIKSGKPQQNYMADSAGAVASRERIAPYAPPPSSVIVMPEPMPYPHYQDEGRDKFKDFEVSPVKVVAEEPVSTFSTDVDTASYSLVRRQLNSGVLPAADAVRVEELINYFDYNYPLPESREQPFKPTITVLDSPWNKDKKLVHIGIKGFDVVEDQKPRSNLVFLIDVSGSMDSPDKLPLVKSSLKMLLDTLQPDDTVALTVYAGSAGTVLEPTKVSDKAKILSAIDNLNAGGSTAGAAGIQEAYRLAEQNFDKEAVNRVIIATDGDFNVGVSSDDELKQIIEKKRETGIFLSVLGFGLGNLNDSLMQTLAQNGNGTAAYIDNLNEARKVLVEEASSTLFTIAKDVKIQVEFNPAQVAEYRLVGYETRALNREDFNNDKVDAGDIGAGHAVTAIYEITPAGSETRSVDELRYGGKSAAPAETAKKDQSQVSDELGFVKIRYKLPDENTSKLISAPISYGAWSSLMPSTCPPDARCKMLPHSDDASWAVAVAGFAQLLKNDPHVGDFDYDDAIELAQANKGNDPYGYRAEFINLMRLAKTLK